MPTGAQIQNQMLHKMESIRLKAYAEIYALSQSYNASTRLEASCFEKSVKAGTLHKIPVWQYSTGTVLFETDKLEAHERELMASYLDAIEEVKEKLKLPEVKKCLIANPDSNEDFEAFTAFGSWRQKYFNGIATAKRILEEKVDESSFIQCKHCKSNAVDTEQKQTRSADEPMTIFCSCRKCGKRFRID